MTNSLSESTDGFLEKSFFDARRKAAMYFSKNISGSESPIPVNTQQNRKSIQQLQSERFLNNTRRLMKE